MRRHQPPCGITHRKDVALAEDLVTERNAEGSDWLLGGKRRNEPVLDVDRGLDAAQLPARHRDVQIVTQADLYGSESSLPNPGGL